MQRFVFPRKSRLLNASDYNYVFDQVEYRVGKGPFLILARQNQLGYPRLGLVVRKKLLKKAVDRNLVKRLAREHFRLSQHQIANLDILVMNRSGSEGKNRKQLNRYLNKAFAQLPKAACAVQNPVLDSNLHGSGFGA